MIIKFKKTLIGEFDEHFINKSLENELDNIELYMIEDTSIDIGTKLKDKYSLDKSLPNLAKEILNDNYELIEASNNDFFFKGINSGILKLKIEEVDHSYWSGNRRKSKFLKTIIVKGKNWYWADKEANIKIYKKQPPNIKIKGTIHFEKLTIEPIDLIKKLRLLNFTVEFKSSYEIIKEFKKIQAENSRPIINNYNTNTNSSNDYGTGLLTGALLYNMFDD